MRPGKIRRIKRMTGESAPYRTVKISEIIQTGRIPGIEFGDGYLETEQKFSHLYFPEPGDDVYCGTGHGIFELWYDRESGYKLMSITIIPNSQYRGEFEHSFIDVDFEGLGNKFELERFLAFCSARNYTINNIKYDKIFDDTMLDISVERARVSFLLKSSRFRVYKIYIFRIS